MEQVPRGLHTWQVEKAQHSGFSPAVCPNRFKSASKNGLFKKNQRGEAENLAKKLNRGWGPRSL